MQSVPALSNKTAVLIDGANLFATAKNLGFDIDFKLLKSKLEEKYNVHRIYYYTALVEQDGEKILLKPLVDWLTYNGFMLITKSARVMINREGVKKIKGNMDVEIAVDAMNIANLPGMTDIVFFTGDGDFRYLVEDIQRKGVKVTIFSSIITNTAMIADNLRKQCDEFIELDSWKDRIRKPITHYAIDADEEEVTNEEVE